MLLLKVTVEIENRIDENILSTKEFISGTFFSLGFSEAEGSEIYSDRKENCLNLIDGLAASSYVAV